MNTLTEEQLSQVNAMIRKASAETLEKSKSNFEVRVKKLMDKHAERYEKRIAGEIERAREKANRINPIFNAQVMRINVLTELRYMYRNDPNQAGILLGCAYAFDLPDSWWNKRSDLSLGDWADLMLGIREIKDIQYEKETQPTEATKQASQNSAA